MIYKIALVGFLLFIGALCYCLTVVAKMADEEEEEMLKDFMNEEDNKE